MQALVLTDNLRAKLSFAFHAVSSRSQLPILLNFLIKAEKGSLTISATDLEIGIRVDIPAKIEKEGETTVPAKTFFDLVSNINEEKLTIETEGNELLLKGEHTKTSFPTISPEEFPKILDEKGKRSGVIKKGDGILDLPKITLAASSDMGRPALSGVFLKKEGKGITMVATDGYRLSLKKNFMSGLSTDSERPLLIPARILRELSFSKDGEGDIEFYVSDKNNQVVFGEKETILVGRLIDAEFPDYQKILPADFATKVSFDKQDAHNAVKACSVFAREAANIVKLSIGKDKVTFSSSASSVGENSVDVEAKVAGEENEIAFNARYLLEFFSVMPDGDLDFEMMGPLNPGVFRAKSDPDFLHLIMPIRVQG